MNLTLSGSVFFTIPDLIPVQQHSNLPHAVRRPS
jgi:hypothetical protein